jgi:pimeloyl-ACP methyl ester carboxylesterase
MGYSDPGPSPRTTRRIAHELAQLLDRGGVSGPVILVGASIGGLTARVFASEHAERVAGLVLVDASHEDQEEGVPQIAPFVPFLSSVGVLRLLGVSFGPPAASLAPSVRGFARATAFRAAGQSAAVDEIMHLQESAAEVRATRRKLTVPVVVVTAGRGSDPVWRDLQRDQVGLSQRGCQVIADQSGHAVAIGQPQVVVDAIRATVDAARGRRDVALCG